MSIDKVNRKPYVTKILNPSAMRPSAKNRLNSVGFETLSDSPPVTDQKIAPKRLTQNMTA